MMNFVVKMELSNAQVVEKERGSAYEILLNCLIILWMGIVELSIHMEMDNALILMMLSQISGILAQVKVTNI